MFDSVRNYDYSKLGVEPLVWELNIPSGVMVVGNDLRPQFDIFGDFDIFVSKGLAQTTLAMAEIGCSYAYVGNSCPGVYRQGDNTYTIAAPCWCEETDQETLPKGELVASIVTDLWWYSIVDKDEFDRRFPDNDYAKVDLVNVRPGVYQFEYYGFLDKHFYTYEDSEPFIFTRIKWIRKPDLPCDFLAKIAKQNFTAQQVVWQMLKDEHDFRSLLYGEQLQNKDRDDKVQRLLAASRNENFTETKEWNDALEDLQKPQKFLAKRMNEDKEIQKAVRFLFFDSWGDWHPNGFIQFNPLMTNNTPEIPIHKFNRCYYWRDFCEYSNLGRAAGLHPSEDLVNLSKSFYDLALNVLDCIIEHGRLKKDGSVDLEIIPIAKEYRQRIVERFGKKFDRLE